MDLQVNLRIYSAEELRLLAYKNDIESYHSYIVENAKYGFTSLDIELDQSRQAVVVNKLRELFPGTTFTYIGISSNKDTLGYSKYKVSWRRITDIKDTIPLKAVQYLRY